MSYSSIAVIGAGTMGRGIIQTAVTHGLFVHAFESNEQQQQKAAAQIQKSIQKAVQRGKSDLDNPGQALDRIQWAESLPEAVAEAQFVIEAVSENEELKRRLFRELDRASASDVILASNTSSVSITRLASETHRPQQIVGMHFFNPVPHMRPVEIVEGLKTSSVTVEATWQLAVQMGKEAFRVSDSPGFAVNRILMPMINEAVFALQEGVANRETIDSLMKLGCNHPMGPLELADFVGLDICLSILQVLHSEFGDPKFRPCPLLVRMVNGGELGKKTGQGFYSYSS